jgi:hypothetical protein
MFFDQRPNTWIRAIVVILTTEIGASCRGPLPCPDCDDAADDMQPDEIPEDTVPDLPCGGADLLTDPRNCGDCGYDCLEYPGTEWEVGSCQMGVCRGPTWGICSDESYESTCAEICAVDDRSCVAKGCAGQTALLFSNGWDFNFEWCNIPDDPPYATMDGSCDELIPWEHDDSSSVTNVLCCCE